jgi:hypothetical protein
MTALGSLVVSLEANIAKFTSDMGKAAYQTEQAMAQMKRDAQVVGAAMGAMAAGAGTALAVLVKSSIDAADTLRDMSQKTGIAVETLNGLGFAASQAGGNLESMVGAAGKLNKSIAEAAQGGNKPAEAFKALGINVTDASGKLKTADVVMAEVADRFGEFEDGPEKVAIALALFGKAGADIIPVLNDGGSAMRDNIAYAQQYSGMTTELANASDNFNDTMGKLQIQQQGFANTMTAAVLPILQAVADETLDAAEQSDKFTLAATAARTVLQTFVVLGSEVAFVFRGVGKEIGGMAAQLAAMARGDFKAAFGIGGIGDMMTSDAEKARAEHDAFISRIMAPPLQVPAAATTVTAAAKPRAPRLKDADKVDKAAKEQQKLIDDGKALAASLLAQDSGLSADFAKKWDSLSTAYHANAVSLDVLLQAQDELLSQQPAIKAAADAAAKADIDGFKAMNDLRKAAEDDAKRNAKNVEQIRITLMNEVDQEAWAHQQRLTELQTYHDTKFENIAKANALIEAENTRHQQVLANMQSAHDLQSLAMMGSTADQIYSLLQKSGKDQSALGKAVFIASKAIAVAEILLNTEVAAAKAGAQLGIFGIPMASMIRATGYASAGMVAGLAIAEASAEGGYDIPSGKNPVTQLHEREMVLPKQQADVIRGLAAKGGGSTAPVYVTQNFTVGDVASISMVRQAVAGSERRIAAGLGRSMQYGGALS